MKSSFRLLFFFTLILLLALTGCFPSKKIEAADPNSLSADDKIETPSKLFISDSSVILFENGYSVTDSLIMGTGKRVWLNTMVKEGFLQVPRDSVEAINYYQKEQSGGTVIGSAVMAITGAILTPLSIHCISCPKCCFGSCPTVYTPDENDYKLEAELFSYSLSKFYQETDLDKLHQRPESDGTFKLRLANEAMETHYINQLNLMAVSHSPDSELFPSPNGDIISAKNLHPPDSVTDSKGSDIQHLILERDHSWHQSASLLLNRVQKISDRDWLDLTFHVPESAEQVKLVLRIRNTLLSTVLFYDVVLASQGIHAVEWTEKLNTDQTYATFYHAAYKSFAGIDVSFIDEKGWVRAHHIGDVGPIAWKEVGIELPARPDNNGKMNVRLEWFPENFMIDYIGVDSSSSNTKSEIHSIEYMSPVAMVNFNGENSHSYWTSLENDDTDFLITQPGDYFDFDYIIPQMENFETTLFLKSKGYYTEWLRGDWISKRGAGYRFNLFEPYETLEQLKKSWSESRTLLEKTFFETKIPLKEEL